MFVDISVCPYDCSRLNYFLMFFNKNKNNHENQNIFLKVFVNKNNNFVSE